MQAGPAENLFCHTVLFYSEKPIAGEMIAVAEDGGDLFTILSSVPHLALGLKLG